MRRAMAEAEVGDDVLDGDPTVRRLEKAGALLLGVEATLFVPSGTMANQIAVGVHTRPGDEVILDADSHVLRYEAGALGALHGVQTVTLRTANGAPTAAEVQKHVRPAFEHCPRSALLCLEQTHMSSGGRVVPLDAFAEAARAARDAGLRVHLDGARLANAVVASGVPAEEWVRHVHSVSLCLSKGLGAPVGSLVGGDAAFCARARILRKRFGGWMRQSGILAAGGLFALERNFDRLARDHELAKSLASEFAKVPGLGVDADRVETNIVLVRVDHPEHDAPSLSAALAEHGVLVYSLDPDHLRFVTHLDVGPEDVARAAGAARAVLA
jgi:threonine aldolase